MEKQEREKQGIKAIIFLQKIAGITETTKTARMGWEAMSKHEQDFTLKLYEQIKKQQKRENQIRHNRRAIQRNGAVRNSKRKKSRDQKDAVHVNRDRVSTPTEQENIGDKALKG